MSQARRTRRRLTRGYAPSAALVALMPLARDEAHLTAIGVRLKRGFRWIGANTLPVDWLVIGLCGALLAAWVALT